jgi:DNA-directed RNA polymerase specialized sigma24 family protein
MRPNGEAQPRFLTTRWTVMGSAGDASCRDRAWEHFCLSYWYPVYAFIRRRGTPADEAADLTQGFFAKLIEQDWLAKVERRDTRFSTLLITVLKNHLAKRHHYDSALKRGGGETPLSLEMARAENWFGAEPVTPETPESLFEKRWALAVMDAALGRLREECETAGKAALFAALSPFLSREPSPGDYDEAAARLGIHPKSVAVGVHRLRADYRAMVREEVAAGLNNRRMVDEEMTALAQALGL